LCDATLILAKYLKENGQEGFVYVCGMRDGHSHAWLRRDGLIVDITGDQFPDNGDSVCVSRGSAWHAQFEIDCEDPSDIDLYDDFTRFNLGRRIRKDIAASAGPGRRVALRQPGEAKLSG
jgi:hypothetical protein